MTQTPSKDPIDPAVKKNGTKEEKYQKVTLEVDKEALKKLKHVAVAYSYVDREFFPTEESYIAEVEVEDRAKDVIEELTKMGIPAKGYPGDQYFLTNLLVDKPDLVLNLVDTVHGKDRLQTSVPAALELSRIPYTGAGLEGLVIGNDRNLIKRLLQAYQIPTPDYQFIRRAGTNIQEELGLPLIVKLNESGGSVGIDNKAVKETVQAAQKKVDEMLSVYKIPVVVEKFVGGPEVTAVVYDDGQKNHVFLGKKKFKFKPDGKHFFTSLESYEHSDAYTYEFVEEPLASKITTMVIRAFNALHFNDYGKFDIRVDEETNTPYFTDSNPNTAFGPNLGLPLTEVLAMHKISFQEILGSIMTKYAKKIPG